MKAVCIIASLGSTTGSCNSCIHLISWNLGNMDKWSMSKCLCVLNGVLFYNYVQWLWPIRLEINKIIIILFFYRWVLITVMPKKRCYSWSVKKKISPNYCLTDIWYVNGNNILNDLIFLFIGPCKHCTGPLCNSNWFESIWQYLIIRLWRVTLKEWLKWFYLQSVWMRFILHSWLWMFSNEINSKCSPLWL